MVRNKVSRRTWLVSAAAASSGFYGLQQYMTRQRRIRALRAEGYGPLVADRKGRLDLPAGFSYRIIGWSGMTMDDGLCLPEEPDGMGAFPGPDGLTLLVRNHEVDPDGRGPWGPQQRLLGHVDADRLYDQGRGKTPGCGGTTTVVYDTRRQQVVRQFLSLAGTWHNCAGGPTPWNTWISCEETVAQAGVNWDQMVPLFADQNHGYNFEVPATIQPQLTPAIPLTAMGRFNHEAVAFDIASGAVYQTEDRDDGLFYRFLPNQPGELQAGGKLQALALVDHSGADTRNWHALATEFRLGEPHRVKWIDLERIDSPQDDLRYRGRGQGAACFARGEGLWATPGACYFACSSGGAEKKGQIWCYRPSAREGTSGEAAEPGQLELFVETNASELLEAADNITVTPWGDLLLCEDRGGEVIRLVGVTPAGKLYTFAHNHVRAEFAGATFSPDGSTLFVNLQEAGLTLAITGPWQPERT